MLARVRAMRVMQKGKIKKKKSEILHNLIFDYLESQQFDLRYFTNLYVIAWQTTDDDVNDI